MSLSLLEELKKEEYWHDTLERMVRKSNIASDEELSLIAFDVLGNRERVLSLIEAGEYKWSIPKKLKLSKMGTKRKRIVYMYSLQDRYLLGVLYRVFSKFYLNSISSHCYSYKRGVRTLSAIEYLKSNVAIHNLYGLKLDIHAYFNSVCEEYLYKVIKEVSNGEEPIYTLLSTLYFSNQAFDIETQQYIEEYKSLIPGTAFSSFLANYCLKEIDYEISDGMQLIYARYSDDILLFGESEERIKEALSIIQSKLTSLGLEINPDKYEWITPGSEIDFLGLKLLPSGSIDISDNSLRKMKKKIRFMCRDGRKRIELLHKDPYKVARDILGRYNYRVYKCFIQDASKFGWAYYAFRYITVSSSLRELDNYLKDRIRQMITGHNNSANISKVPLSVLEDLGYVSLAEMFKKYKEDIDYYSNEVYLIRG